jgi:hypothetical protein
VEEAALCNDLHLMPLGIPTLVISDDPQLIAAVASVCAYWLAEAPSSEPRVELRLETADAVPSGKVCLDITVEGSRLSLSGPGVGGMADAEARMAYASVTRGAVADAALFTEIVDTLLLFILARDGRVPVHASAIMVGDLAILLAGRTGSGKSSLAHAAATRGLPVLSEDMIFVQREPNFAIWGLPRPIHLLPADAPPGDHPIRMRNGKRKLAVPLRPAEPRATECVLLILDRGEQIRLCRMANGEAVEALMNLEEGFVLLERESRAAATDLAKRGAWRLALTTDPNEAVEIIVQNFLGSY